MASDASSDEPERPAVVHARAVRGERGVVLGSYVNVGTGAILSEGVRVGDRARIAPGALVQPDTLVGERETWSGVPARPATMTIQR